MVSEDLNEAIGAALLYAEGKGDMPLQAAKILADFALIKPTPQPSEVEEAVAYWVGQSDIDTPLLNTLITAAQEAGRLREIIDRSSTTISKLAHEGADLRTRITELEAAPKPEVVTVDEFDEWLADRMNECARAGLDGGDMRQQLAKDFVERFTNGLIIAPAGRV